MKIPLLTCLCSIALVSTLLGQVPSPSASPVASPASPSPAVVAGANISPSVAASVTPDEESDISRDVARKLKRHFGVTIKNPSSVTIDRRHHRDNDSDDDFGDGALMAIPIIGIIFTTLFGAPVMVVAAIMFFSYLKSRSLHRTVRTMVEKGQEVPAALFAAPPVVRARSDMRRGVVLLMIGFGVMIFFGATSDWEGGSWALGIIPFLIGVGYLLVWKLERPKDKVPPLP
jgi:citrate lyase gamma subunit